MRLDARTGEEVSRASFPSPARIAALSTEYAVAITNDEHLAVQAHGQSTSLLCLPSAMCCPSLVSAIHRSPVGGSN